MRRLARARRPFHLEFVADQRRGIEIAFEREGVHPFAAGLLDRGQGVEIAGKRCAGLLGEFADRGGKLLFAGVRLALRDRPDARVLLLPERSAGMDEEHLGSGAAPAVE